MTTKTQDKVKNYLDDRPGIFDKEPKMKTQDKEQLMKCLIQDCLNFAPRGKRYCSEHKTFETQDKQIEENIPHDYKLNGVGGNMCQRCGHFESSPDWPYYCYIKKTQPKSLEEQKEKIESIVWGNFGNICNAMDIDKEKLVSDLSDLFSQQISIAEERGEKRVLKDIAIIINEDYKEVVKKWKKYHKSTKEI